MAFASVFYSYETMQLAVRAGANAIVRDCIHQTNTGISALVKAQTFSLDQSQIQVTVSDPIPANCKSGYPITVRATYNVPFPRVNVPLLGSATIRLGPIPISAASTMTIE